MGLCTSPVPFSLPDKAACSFSKLEWDPHLNALTCLSNKAAACLSEHCDWLSLYRLKKLTDKAAENLGRDTIPQRNREPIG